MKVAAQQVIKLTPEDNPHKTYNKIMLRVVEHLSSNTKYINNPDIYKIPNNIFILASRQENANLFMRMITAFLAVEELLSPWKNGKHNEEAYLVVCDAIDLMTRIHSCSLTPKNRQNIIKYDFQFILIAYSLALRLEKQPLKTLKLLEQGEAKCLGPLKALQLLKQS